MPRESEESFSYGGDVFQPAPSIAVARPGPRPAPGPAPAPRGAPAPPRPGIVTPAQLDILYNTYLGRPPGQSDYDIHLTGGFRNNPAGLENSIANSPEALAFANRQMAGPAFPEFGGFEFEMPGLSDQEVRYYDLINSQIQQQIELTNKNNAQVEARRAALSTLVKNRYGMSLEEFDANQAFNAAEVSQSQADRLRKALAGELPVDPSLERQIGVDEKSVRDKLLAQVGPGYETSTPGIQSLADFRQRAEELRSAARHDEIAAGIGPAAASAQYGLSLIGAPTSQDTTSVAQALQASIGSRNAGIAQSQARSNAFYQAQQLAQQERLAQLDYDIKRRQLDAATGARSPSGTTSVVRTGSGYGTAAGAGAGYVASNFLRDPFSN
jgi:hypothetical protein